MMRLLRGITLLEMMVALLIGMLVMEGLGRIYLSIQHLLSQQIEITKLTENFRTASFLLNDSIHKAGYGGFSNLHTPIIYPYVDSKPGFTLKYMDTLTNDLMVDMENATQLIVNISPRYHKNDLIFISDGITSEVAKLDNVIFSGARQILNVLTPLKKHYKQFSLVSSYQEESYFVSATNRKNNDGEVINALFKKTNQTQKNELIDGVDEMKLRYAVLKNNQLLMQKNPDDFEHVVGLEIMLRYSKKYKEYIYVSLRH